MRILLYGMLLLAGCGSSEELNCHYIKDKIHCAWSRTPDTNIYKGSLIAFSFIPLISAVCYLAYNNHCKNQGMVSSSDENEGL